MIMLGWYIAAIIWVLGMWLSFRINQSILDDGYRELMDQNTGFLLLVTFYSVITILFWPVVQLVAMQRAFSHSGEEDEEE